MLEAKFKLEVLGDLKYFLGLEMARSKQGIHLCQRKNTMKLLTHRIPRRNLVPYQIQHNDTNGKEMSEPSLYRRLIGRLMYLTISRPDITFIVNRHSKFMAHPRTSHLQAVHHLLEYLKGTPGQGILFPTAQSLKVNVYVHTDWGS